MSHVFGAARLADAQRQAMGARLQAGGQGRPPHMRGGHRAQPRLEGRRMGGDQLGTYGSAISARCRATSVLPGPATW